MIRCDYHMHSSFSGDSESPMEEMLEAGIRKGLQAICITEHNDPDFIYIKEDEKGMFDLDTESYLNKAALVKELYKDKIQLFSGVEIGVQEHIGNKLESYVSSHPFDFVIASSHLCDGMDPYYPEFFEGRSDKEAFRAYFASIDRNIRAFRNFDVYGHLDYVVRYAPNKNHNYHIHDYTDILESILRYLIENGKGLEVNTGGFRAGLGCPNPCIDILKLYRSFGGEIITVGSDAHIPADIAYSFSSIEELLKECGFSYYTMFAKRKPQFVKL